MRLRTMIIFGAGYIWGARTGHDRLLELTDRARDFLNSDVVRDYLQRAQVRDQLAGSESEEPEEFEDEDLEDEDLEDEDLRDEDIEDEELDEPEPEESGEDGNDGNEEPPPARSRPQVRRRAPGRSRR
jgi:hypothetical protein